VRLGILAAGVGVLVGGATLWLALTGSGGSGGAAARKAAPARAPGASPAGVPPVDRPNPRQPPLPATVVEAEPEPGRELEPERVRDAGVDFVAARDALDLFDQYLAASEEEPDGVVRARIEAAIAAQLDDPAPALELLDRYLAYREAMRALVHDEGAPALSLERRLQRMRELRVAHFGPELAAELFEAEEKRWRADVERLRVLRDPALGPQERAERLEAIDAELPEAVRRSRATPTSPLLFRREEARLRAAGASDAEIDALREARLHGAERPHIEALDRLESAGDAP
jgi:lipase chaperone LimK